MYQVSIPKFKYVGSMPKVKMREKAGLLMYLSDILYTINKYKQVVGCNSRMGV
jgi:hypothetical protein